MLTSANHPPQIIQQLLSAEANQEQPRWCHEGESCDVPTTSERLASYISVRFVFRSPSGTLLTSDCNIEDAKSQFTELREAYLPQTILAYVSMLNFAGRMLTRDFLLECMELSSVIADEESDLLPLFEKTGTMQELVQGFALAGKTLLLLSCGKKSSGGRPKRLRSKGWTHDLWAIKLAQPRQAEEDE